MVCQFRSDSCLSRVVYGVPRRSRWNESYSSVHISSKSTADSEFHVVTTVTIAFLGLLFNRPITVFWDRYLKRRGWLPADVESQAPTALNCQDRSSGAEGGSNQGLVDPPVSAGGEVSPASGEPIRTEESMESRMCSESEARLLALVASERRGWV